MKSTTSRSRLVNSSQERLLRKKTAKWTGVPEGHLPVFVGRRNGEGEICRESGSAQKTYFSVFRRFSC